MSVLLRGEGISRTKAFNYGQLSAIVEPVSAVVGAAYLALRISFCSWCHDFCSSGRVNSGITISKKHGFRNDGPYGWICDYDGA